jgi:hypothetical protein
MNQVWKPVVGYEGLYEVSDQGEVRAPDKVTSTKGGGSYRRPGRSIAQSKGRYLSVCLYKDGRKSTKLVHLLVAEAFLGPRPSPHYVVCHGPGGQHDNSVGNLRYDTQTKNLADREAVGSVPRGESHGRAVLTADQVLFIRSEMSKGASSAALAREFGVSPDLPWKIYKRLLWKHL